MCMICTGHSLENSVVNLGYIHKGLALADHGMNQLMTQHEQYQMDQADSSQDGSSGSLFVLPHMNIVTKLRPSFLKKASAMFEMYIYTMGDRPYAFEMAQLLDPENKYFDGRVISPEDGTQKHQKGHDVILGKKALY